MDTLHDVRPSLKSVSPLTNWICLGYAFINAGIGLGLIFLLPHGRLITNLFLINKIFTFAVWGGIFLALSITMFVGKILNDWDFLRKTLLAGITIKTLWLGMLIQRTTHNPATIIWTMVWAFFLYVQIGTYIYFLPVMTGTRNAK